MTCLEIDALVRALLGPYPRAFIVVDGTKLEIGEVRVADIRASHRPGRPRGRPPGDRRPRPGPGCGAPTAWLTCYLTARANRRTDQVLAKTVISTTIVRLSQTTGSPRCPVKSARIPFVAQ